MDASTPAIAPATLEELRLLSRRYASGVDRRDRELLLSAFHPDATLTVVRAADAGQPPRPMRGHPEIGRVVDRIAGYDQTFHFLGQSDYALTAAGATGEVACIAHHRWTEGDDDLDHVMYITYADEYRVGADEHWRIAARTVGVEWSETQVLDRPGRRPR